MASHTLAALKCKYFLRQGAQGAIRWGDADLGKFFYCALGEKAHLRMATVRDFELACPACDGPGLYVTEEGARLRAGYTSNLVRHMGRHRPLRILSVAHLEPGRTTRAWRALLRLLRARAFTPREVQFDASP